MERAKEMRVRGGRCHLTHADDKRGDCVRSPEHGLEHALPKTVLLARLTCEPNHNKIGLVSACIASERDLRSCIN
jgi:hypothetical protein